MNNLARIQQTIKYLFLAEDSTDSIAMNMLQEITQVDQSGIQWLGVVKTFLWTLVAIALPIVL